MDLCWNISNKFINFPKIYGEIQRRKMSKKSESGNGKNVNKVRGSKQDREERSDNQKHQGKSNDYQEKSGNKHDRSQEVFERKTERDGEKNRKKMDGGNAPKNGCFPKLFMLLLPFVAAGTYFFLRL